MQQIQKVGSLIFRRNILKNVVSRNMSKNLYEPPYLEELKSKIPLHNDLNIQIKGYDYPILESYQKFVHNLLKSIEINVEECWGTPASHAQILKYKSKSSVLDSEYKLSLYERNIQVTDVTATQYPTLVRILEACLPAGVQLSIHEHDDFSEEVRYVPDKELIQLKTQLEDMSSSKKK